MPSEVIHFRVSVEELSLLDKLLETVEGDTRAEKLKNLIVNLLLKSEPIPAQQLDPTDPLDCKHFARDPKDPKNFCYCRARKIPLEYCLKTHRRAVSKKAACYPPYMKNAELFLPANTESAKNWKERKGGEVFNSGSLSSVNEWERGDDF